MSKSYLQIRVDDDFKKRIIEAANFYGLDMSSYVRDRINTMVRKDLVEKKRFNKELES